MGLRQFLKANKFVIGPNSLWIKDRNLLIIPSHDHEISDITDLSNTLSTLDTRITTLQNNTPGIKISTTKTGSVNAKYGPTGALDTGGNTGYGEITVTSPTPVNYWEFIIRSMTASSAGQENIGNVSLKNYSKNTWYKIGLGITDEVIISNTNNPGAFTITLTAKLSTTSTTFKIKFTLRTASNGSTSGITSQPSFTMECSVIGTK